MPFARLDSILLLSKNHLKGGIPAMLNAKDNQVFMDYLAGGQNKQVAREREANACSSGALSTAARNAVGLHEAPQGSSAPVPVAASVAPGGMQLLDRESCALLAAAASDAEKLAMQLRLCSTAFADFADTRAKAERMLLVQQLLLAAEKAEVERKLAVEKAETEKKLHDQQLLLSVEKAEVERKLAVEKAEMERKLHEQQLALAGKKAEAEISHATGKMEVENMVQQQTSSHESTMLKLRLDHEAAMAKVRLEYEAASARISAGRIQPDTSTTGKRGRRAAAAPAPRLRRSTRRRVLRN